MKYLKIVVENNPPLIFNNYDNQHYRWTLKQGDVTYRFRNVDCDMNLQVEIKSFWFIVDPKTVKAFYIDTNGNILQDLKQEQL